MNVREYLAIARERWIVVFLGLALGLGAGGAVALGSTPQYEAGSKFFISARGVGPEVDQAYQGSLLSEQKMKSYVDLATDRRVRDQVAAQLGSPVAPGVIKAAAKPETVVLTVTATDPSPRRAQAIANLASTAFAELVTEVERSEGGESSVIARQINEAKVPQAPVWPKQKTAVALGLFIGLMLGMALAVARHLLDRTVKSSAALADLVGAPVLGVAPWDQHVKSRPLIVHDQPRAPLAEAIRLLRTNLDFVDLDHTNKLIAVTSAVPNEGKTTTACNLAIALAQAGNRVLLVEADLRWPRAAAAMGMENAVGLTTVLTGQADLDAAIQPWAGGLLDFLGAGALPPNPSELLASAQMATVLDELNERYDVVILDSAPTLPVADGVALAAHCHGVVFVSRHGWARAEEIKAAVENLRRLSVPIFGMVFSMAPRSKRSDVYGYGYAPSKGAKTSATAAATGVHLVPAQSAARFERVEPVERAEEIETVEFVEDVEFVEMDEMDQFEAVEEIEAADTDEVGAELEQSDEAETADEEDVVEEIEDVEEFDGESESVVEAADHAESDPAESDPAELQQPAVPAQRAADAPAGVVVIDMSLVRRVMAEKRNRES
ncbi:MAG: polysaccharide biosynthesis tyrosine autokinase [Sporichthyaceae bacterium]